jgi:hypothetical protein
LTAFACAIGRTIQISVQLQPEFGEHSRAANVELLAVDVGANAVSRNCLE